VQQQANPRRLPTEKESENWFLEGTANLFAYSFYQDQDMLEATEFEGLSIRAYDPSVPLHQQTYTTSLFFLYLNNKGWTREKIHKWVANRNFSADSFDEQAAISRDVEISDAFRTFAIAFHDKQIAFRYPSGLLIYIENKKEIETTSKTVNLARVSEKTTLDLKVRPWAFAKYVVTLAAGQNIKVSDDIIRVGTKNTIWYRAKGLTAKWKELPSTGLTTGCRRSSIEYEFLMVSTASTDEITGKMTFLYKAECKADCKVGTPPVLRARQVDSNTTTAEGPSGITTTLPATFSLAAPTLRTLPAPTPAQSTDGYENQIDVDKNIDTIIGSSDEEPVNPSCGSCVIGNWTLDIATTSASQRKNVKVNGRSHIYQEELHGTQVMWIKAKSESERVHAVHITVNGFGNTIAVEQFGEVISRTPTTATGYANATIRLENVVTGSDLESGLMVMQGKGGEGTTTWIKADGKGTVVTEPYTGLGKNAAYLWYNCTASSLVYREQVDGMMFYTFFHRT
jgi:hypothetical protein